MVCWVRCSSDDIWALLSWVRCGWDQLWFPIHMPASRCARTRDWLFWAFWPVLNIVARRPFEVSALSRLAVLPPLGPSSNVSPT